MRGDSQSPDGTRVWPTGTDYSRAVQSPVASFSDAELAAGKVGTNALGMPLVASGPSGVSSPRPTRAPSATKPWRPTSSTLRRVL